MPISSTGVLQCRELVGCTVYTLYVKYKFTYTRLRVNTSHYIGDKNAFYIYYMLIQLYIMFLRMQDELCMHIVCCWHVTQGPFDLTFGIWYCLLRTPTRTFLVTVFPQFTPILYSLLLCTYLESVFVQMSNNICYLPKYRYYTVSTYYLPIF